MRKLLLLLPPATLLGATLLLAGCGGRQSKMETTTPTATLGTDSAQVQAGGPAIASPIGGAADTITSHRLPQP